MGLIDFVYQLESNKEAEEETETKMVHASRDHLLLALDCSGLFLARMLLWGRHAVGLTSLCLQEASA